jgi:hypothetical protein
MMKRTKREKKTTARRAVKTRTIVGMLAMTVAKMRATVIARLEAS